MGMVFECLRDVKHYTLRRSNGLSRFLNGFSSLGPKSDLFCGVVFQSGEC